MSLGTKKIPLSGDAIRSRKIPNNDGLVTNLLVKFMENSPNEILAKIKGLDENNTVWLDSNALENAAYNGDGSDDTED